MGQDYSTEVPRNENGARQNGLVAAKEVKGNSAGEERGHKRMLVGRFDGQA